MLGVLSDANGARSTGCTAPANEAAQRAFRTRTVIAAGAVACGQGGDEVILLYSEESIEHSRKVGGSAFAEALVHLTKPLDIAPTDQRAPDVEERLRAGGRPGGRGEAGQDTGTA